jgi:vacuolar protein sorting-associated protein 13A/C
MSGVSGVVTKPISGAQSGGIGGFFKGAGIGLAGLVTKPVSGMVDLVTKTSQGIETQVTGTPECDQNMKRMR